MLIGEKIDMVFFVNRFSGFVFGLGVGKVEMVFVWSWD